jgi:hypothetical protein
VRDSSRSLPRYWHLAKKQTACLPDGERSAALDLVGAAPRPCHRRVASRSALLSLESRSDSERFSMTR